MLAYCRECLGGFLDFEVVKLPKKITPCKIIEAAVEMRFESQHPPEVIPGLVFNSLKDQYPKMEALPIMQLPPTIRDTDPNLRYSPQFRFSNSDFIFQIGPRSFSVVCPKAYKGWTKYSEKIYHGFESICELGIIDKPIRVGVRYISFFDNVDIFRHIKLDFKLSNNDLVGSRNIIRTEFDYEDYKCVIQIANSAILDNKQEGSTIDIDIITDKVSVVDSSFKIAVEAAHKLEKKLFFSFLNPEFLKNFSPEY
jgi:uncharacterized protein (TIGR04255 family)